ncbi:MAG: ectonucleotide pyrophosphatase/phosphodiesterase, partial [Bryobacteraceae bacterium]|nr:ectonucleotide pyrophosphatase/phosphodiesterase [Bryobacteraceae bacterium]
DYAPGPLMQAARSVYALSGALDKLRHFPNFEDGHNYGPTSRRALYEFLKTHFGAPINTVEGTIETRTAEQLRVPMPADNATFQSLARDLSRNLPAKTSVTREQLIEVLRLPTLDGSFTVPVTTHGPAAASETVLLIADEGRASQTSRIDELTAQGKRVIAVDPFYFGESKLASTAHLFAMQLAAIGERPLGLQVAQVIATAKSANTPVRIEAHGRRTSFIALLAAAIETQAINGVRLYNAMTSLKQLIDEGIRVDQQPEMFCFGLLEVADIPQIAQLVAPRPVETATAQGRKLLVISVDGLDHRYLRDAAKLGLRIPNMRKLAQQGEWADGVLGVVPTVTWPSHTTLITGVRPDQHGILGNRRPRSEGGDYYWTADLLKTKTLWHATRAARKTSAAITWPVTVNADIDYNLPEAFARRNGGGMDLATIEAKATKGLVAEIAKADPTFRQEWMDDRTRAIATAYLLKNKRPDLLLLHFVDHDAAAHDHGPFTPEANKSMEYTDELIGQLIEAAGNDYVIALTADHGFERIDRIIVPPVPASPGLLMATTEGQVNQVRRSKLGRQIPPHEFLRFAPNRKDVKAAFEPPPHTMFGPKEGPPHEKGNHGLWPARKDYRSVFVLYGPGIKARKAPEMSMLDIAPRLAAILGVTLPRN